MTDHQLQLLLAAKLPEKLWHNPHRDSSNPLLYCWKGQRDSLTGIDIEVRPTEWDYIVRLVLKSVPDDVFHKFTLKLAGIAHERFPAGETDRNLINRYRLSFFGDWQDAAQAMKECGII